MWQLAKCFVAALFAVSFATGMTSRAGGADYALIVGVNDCPQFRLPEGTRSRPLRGAERDAEAVAKVLVERFGFPAAHVRVLKGADATAETVRIEFEKFAKQLGPRDSFVFHFSGHGTQTADSRPFDEPDELDEALCLADAQGDGTGLVLDDDLARWLDAFVARDITVLLDCCHAGTGTKDGDDDVAARYLPTIRPVAAPVAGERPWRELSGTTKSLDRRRAAFFACRPEQQAYERRMPNQTAPARSGQFTHFFLEGLSGKADTNDDQRITYQEALRYVQARLDESFNRARSNARERQEPTLEADDGERTIFGGAVPSKR